MKIKSGLYCLVAIGLTLHTDILLAVELLEDHRMVNTFFDGGSNIVVPDQDFAEFNVAYQNTSVGPDAFGGSGDGYGESDFTFFIAESTFEILFRVTEITDIALTGYFEANDGSFGAASVAVQLYSNADTGTGISIYTDQIFGNDSGEFDYTAPLATGVYRLVIHTNITPGGFDTTGYYSFDALFSPSTETDLDSDGIPDATDNCTQLANHRQADSDGDGIGNQCDPDLVDSENVCRVDFADLNVFKMAFFTSEGDSNWNPDADFAGDPIDGGPDSFINFVDLTRMSEFFFAQPGPSATGCH